MKTRIFTLAIAILGFTSASFAQSSATATSTAELLTPLSIIKDIDLSFGRIASSATAGTAAIEASEVGTRTVTNGVAALGGSPSPAKFTVTGAKDQYYGMVTPPSTIQLTNESDGTKKLDLVLTYSNNAKESRKFDSNGKNIFYVGGSINIPAGTIAGIYSNATGLTVTVAYE